MGNRPFVLAAVIVIALPLLLASSASAFVLSGVHAPSPAAVHPVAAIRPAPAPAPARPTSFLQQILEGPIPVSGVVAVGPPPASYPGNPPLTPAPAPGLAVLAPTPSGVAPVARALIQPIGAQYRVTNQPSAQNEISLAVNPNNPLNIVASANDYRGYPGIPGDGWCGVYATKDGGRTWVEQLVPRTGPLLQVNASGDPGVAFDADGNVYYSCLGFNRDGSANVIAVSKSTDGGSTWNTPTQVVGTTANVFHDKSYIAVDRSNASTRGTVYVTWTRFMPGPDCGPHSIPIYISRSADGGQTWSPEQDITTPGFKCDQGSEPAVAADGTLYVSYMNWYGGGERAVIQKSTNGGVSFGAPVTVAQVTDTLELFGGAPRTPDFPSFAVNPVSAPTGNRLHMVWADSGTGEANIYMSTSNDGGATWSPRLQVNEPTSMNVHFFPWVSASQNGRVDVEFYGGNNDPTLWYISDWVASSFDFGVSIAFNVRASPDFSPGNWFIGDYNNIASFGDFAYPGWCDYRLGSNNYEVWMAGPPLMVNRGLPSMSP